jgi:acyl-CoA synthetase (AMP-forming)/AMP-acid ligase II
MVCLLPAALPSTKEPGPQAQLTHGLSALLLRLELQVCLRGPVMFSGYYKQPQLTAESTDKEGFFHTGGCGGLHTWAQKAVGCVQLYQ